MDVQKNFSKINDRLSLHREYLEDRVIERMLGAYDFINSLIGKKIDLFTPAGLYSMLELNHLILCGKDESSRREFHSHIVETRRIFQRNIKPIVEWYKTKKVKQSIFKLVTGYYAKVLSFPQLFIEGNHRTGTIVMNYYLVNNDIPPLILNTENAYEYFELSGDIKFTDKQSFAAEFKLLGYRKRMQDVIEKYGREIYIT